MFSRKKIASCILGFVLASFSTLSSALTGTDEILKNIVGKNPQQLKSCSEEGNRICERNLGILYAYNFKLPNGESSRDIKQARSWLSKTTLYPISRYILGKIYINEIGNEKVGESLLLSSCVEDNKEACFTLYGIWERRPEDGSVRDDIVARNAVYAIRKIIKIHNGSISMVKDYKNYKDPSARDLNGKLARLLIKRKDPDAISLLEKEVEADAPFASSLLAPLYETGELAPKNLIRAYMMYDLSGSGYADEKAKVAEQMTPEQVREAQEMSWQWQDTHRSYRAGYRGGDIGIYGGFKQR